MTPFFESWIATPRKSPSPLPSPVEGEGGFSLYFHAYLQNSDQPGGISRSIGGVKKDEFRQVAGNKRLIAMEQSRQGKPLPVHHRTFNPSSRYLMIGNRKNSITFLLPTLISVVTDMPGLRGKTVPSFVLSSMAARFTKTG